MKSFLERFHVSTDYQEAENCERIHITKELGHTISFEVEMIIATLVSQLCYYVLPDDDFVVEEVNCCTKVFL